MKHLILVRHSVPEVESDQPARLWSLSEEGRARCLSLAEDLRLYQPDVILSSVEPKARQTAELLANWLNLSWEIGENLHEHERTRILYLSSQPAFHTALRSFFLNPTELIFGDETAFQALNRFEIAISQILLRHPNKNVLVVSHGTVISLLVAHQTGVDAFEFWQTLKLPDFIVLPLPNER